VEGMPEMRIRIDQFCQCKTCALAKATRSSHTGLRTHPTHPLELLTTDILDPLVPNCVDDKNLIVSFTCPYTDYTTVRRIAHKNDVAIEFAEYHKWLTNKFKDYPVAEMRSDNAKEYISGNFRAYLQAAGIMLDSGNAYSAELQGIAERKNRTVLEFIRIILIDAGMPPTCWCYALDTVEYILNRIYNFQIPVRVSLRYHA